MSVKEKLIELLDAAFLESDANYGMPSTIQVADHLIANGVTVQEWIPASEPPKECGEYIVMIRDAVIATSLFYSKHDKVWHELGDYEYKSPYNVTCWMPLPRPPKGE